MKYTFEEYLKNLHADTYFGTDDDMPEAYEAWLSTLGEEGLLNVANDFAKTKVERALRKLADGRHERFLRELRELTND